MADRQAIASGATEPVFVNETGALQAIAGVVYLNETASPFIQTEWATAIRLDSRQAREAAALNRAVLTPVVVVTLPFSQSDWPLPDRIDSIRARDPQRSNDLARQLQQVLPYNQTDWPLPKRTDSPLARKWELANDLARQTAKVLPYNQYDWPLPERIDSPLARKWELANDMARRLAKVLPYSQYNWPLPQRVDSPLARKWERANDLARQTARVLPGRPTEWPLAKAPKPSAPEQPPLNIALARTPIVVVTKPFAQLGWTLPTTLKMAAPEPIFVNTLPIHVVPEPDTHDGGWVHDRKGLKKARREQQRRDADEREDRAGLREQVTALIRGVDPAEDSPAQMMAAVRQEPAYKALQQQYPLAELRAILANAALTIAAARQAEAVRAFEQDEEDAIAMLIQ